MILVTPSPVEALVRVISKHPFETLVIIRTDIFNNIVIVSKQGFIITCLPFVLSWFDIMFCRSINQRRVIEHHLFVWVTCVDTNIGTLRVFGLDPWFFVFGETNQNLLEIPPIDLGVLDNECGRIFTEGFRVSVQE